MDEHFATLDTERWTVANEIDIWDTWLLAANVNLIGGGGLRITGEDDIDGNGNYPGGMIYSIPTYLYGYFECRCKVPSPVGTWPAFWLFPYSGWIATSPEIDIMEYFGNEPNQYGVNSWIDGTDEQHTIASGGLTSDYHVFACRWTATEIKFYLDGPLVATNTANIPQVPLSVFVDLFMGKWAGIPTPPEAFPSNFDIDYVKVWQVA